MRRLRLAHFLFWDDGGLIERQSDVDEAVVFRMKEFEGDGRLVVERDCTMITRVFEEYKRLLNQKQ